MDNSEIINIDFVRKFTLSILKTIQKRNLNIKDEPQIISSDLIMKLSNELMEALAIKQEGIMDLINLHENIDSNDTNEIKEEGLNIIEKVNSDIYKSNLPPKSSYSSKIERFNPTNQIGFANRNIKYGKIHTLLMDPMISIINCKGANQQVSIGKRGMFQITKITLSQQDINEILEDFSRDSHIPLIEGPFLAQINDLNVSGVYSTMVGSSFVIRRNR
jgi:hypothetical protein